MTKPTTNIHPALVLGERRLIHSVGLAGIPVYVGSETSDNPARYSRYSRKVVQFSPYDSDAFIDELCELGESLEQKIAILSDDDRALLNISNHRERLKKYYLFMLPETEIVEQVLDKLKFCELSRVYNLFAPGSIEVSSMRDLNAELYQLNPPYIIKPAYRHYWYHEGFTRIVGRYKKAFICSSQDELKTLYEKIAQIHPEVVVQEFIEGDDARMYDVNLYINDSGEVKGSVVARKLRIYPPGAGWGCYVTTVEDPEVLSRAEEIASTLGLRGLVNIQFKRDSRTEEPKLIEIHVRTSIFDILGTAANMNLPAMYYYDLVGNGVPEEGTCETGVKYFHLGRELRLFLRNRKEVNYSLWDWIRTYRGKAIIDNLFLRDPLPIFMNFWLGIKRKFKGNNYQKSTASNVADSLESQGNKDKYLDILI